MTILVLGATGNTGAPLVARLRARQVPVRPANRHPVSGGARFDWSDPTGFRAALDGVHGVYLVPPLLNTEPMSLVEPFLAEARAADVSRVVLLGSLAELPDTPGIDALRMAVREFPEWAELRPSGFMQNMLSGHPAGNEIRTHGRVGSATESGRLGWIDAADIAAVAEAALTGESPVNDELVLTGPESLSYDQMATIITEVTGRPVEHVRVDVTEIRQRNLDIGMPPPFATALAEMERKIAAGSEDLVTGVVRRMTGHEPRSFREFVRVHRGDFAAARNTSDATG